MHICEHGEAVAHAESTRRPVRHWLAVAASALAALGVLVGVAQADTLGTPAASYQFRGIAC
jgi:hypothetical protein